MYSVQFFTVVEGLNSMKKAIFSLFALAVLAAPQLAHAGLVTSTLNDISFQDRNDAVLTRALADAVSRSTNLLNCTRFYGDLIATQIIDGNGGIQSTPISPEVTAVFDVTVQFIIAGTNTSGVAVGTVLTNAQILAGYQGTAYPLFRATNLNGAGLDKGIFGSGTTLLGDGSSMAGLNKAAGVAIALYEGGVSALPLDSGTEAQAIARASDGTYEGGFGFTTIASPNDWGAAGNGYWYGNVTYVGGQALQSNSFYYGLNALDGPLSSPPPTPLYNPELLGNSLPVGTQIANNVGATVTGPGLGPSQTKFDLTGTGNVFKNNAVPPWPGASSDPAHLMPNPEPGSIALALIGGGLFVPMARRRRERKNASTAV